MTASPDNDQGRRERDAAFWCIRMDSEEAADHQSAFNQWLRNDPRNLEAYNRIREIYLLGPKLKRFERVPGIATAQKPQRGLARRILIAGIVLAWGAVALILFIIHTRPEETWPGSIQMSAKDTHLENLSADAVPIQKTLPDMSSVLLAPGSRLAVAYSAQERRLTLLSGNAHFQVAHEGRPFVVAAGGGTVTARGTVFEVALKPDRRVEVKLVSGRIDVLMPASDGTNGMPSRLRRLTPGESLTYEATQVTIGPEQDDRAQSGQEFPGNSTVAEIVAATNAANPAGDRIVLNDPKLAAMPVSGIFRLHDPATVAERLSVIFDLAIDRSTSGRIILRRLG